MRIYLSVIGLPAPKGSSRAMVRGGRAVFVPGGSTSGQLKLRGWNAEVMAAAVEVMKGRPPFVDLPLSAEMVFRLPRPKAHFGKHGLKATAPHWHAVAADVDKICRATLDAMTGIVFDDDSRISVMRAAKHYCALGETPGADIEIHTLEEEQ